jgi:hypothetical protein
VRLKINLPVSLERQEIWRYTDAPVFYTQALRPYYPFREHTLREIEREGYEARYRVIAEGGKARPVVYADMIDCKEEAEARISAQGGVIKYSRYDTASHKEKALLTLNADGESDLFSASIHGRPIVLDLNTTHYETDGAAAALFGTAALNVTGGYFSSDLINGEPHYADWVKRELSARLARKKEYTIKTNKAFVNARVGAKIKLVTKEHNVTGRIHSLKMRYKKEAAFVEILKFSNEAEL